MKPIKYVTVTTRSLGLAAGVLLAAMVLLTLRPGEPKADFAFHITTHTTQEIVGVLNEGSSAVAFESRMESSWQASAQVRVNDLVLDILADLRENLRILDGHGNALSAEERMALSVLSRELEGYLDPYKRNLPPHEDLLVRAVLYWAEAPVGFPLTRQEIRLPSEP
jgi:hypothetical protein